MFKTKSFRNLFDLFRNGTRVIGIARRHMPWISAVQIFLMVTISVIPFFAFKAMGNLVDSIVSASKIGVLEVIWWPLMVYISLNIVPTILSVWQRYNTRIFLMRMQDYFDMMILKKRASFDICQYEDPKFLDFMQRAFAQNYFPLVNLLDGSIGLIGTAFGIVFGFVAAIAVDWKALIIVIITALPTFIIEVKYGGKVWSLFAKNSPEQRRAQDLRRFFSAGNRYSVIDGKLFQVSKNFLASIQKIVNDFTKEQLSTETTRVFYSLLASMVAGVGLFFAFVIIANNAVLGVIAVGTVVYVFQTLNRVSGQISQLLSGLAMILERNLYATDIFSVMDTSPSIKQSLNPQKISKGNAPYIKFENVSFRYPGQETYALRNVSFELQPGEKLGLVGNNGSGKSTLVRLLLRVHDPAEGRITVNGIDLREIKTDEWWDNLGVLLQDFTTYYFSVEEAVGIGRKDQVLNGEVVGKTIDESTLREFVDGLRDKSKHMIGVEFGGVEPSKGQRQKLAIARALYRQPPLLILDEPTASIDSESAMKIFATIESFPSDRSAILISHNFATIKRASMIIVLEKGSIIEQGTHDELIEKNGVYASAYNQQKMDFA